MFETSSQQRSSTVRATVFPNQIASYPFKCVLANVQFVKKETGKRTKERKLLNHERQVYSTFDNVSRLFSSKNFPRCKMSHVDTVSRSVSHIWS